MGRLWRTEIIILAVLCVGSGGCASVPEATARIELERTLDAQFDDVWRAALRVVALSHGTMITQDKASGVMVYVMRPENMVSADLVYMQVFLQRGPREQCTIVRVVPKARYGAYSYDAPVDREFLNLLQASLRKR